VTGDGVTEQFVIWRTACKEFSAICYCQQIRRGDTCTALASVYTLKQHKFSSIPSLHSTIALQQHPRKKYVYVSEIINTGL